VLQNKQKENYDKITREQLKSGETRKVVYVCRYTSGHLIPKQFMVIK